MSAPPVTESSLEVQAAYLVDLVRVAEGMMQHQPNPQPGMIGLMAVITERAERLHEGIEKEGRKPAAAA